MKMNHDESRSNIKNHPRLDGIKFTCDFSEAQGSNHPLDTRQAMNTHRNRHHRQHHHMIES
jgi:hypothetical protein